MSKICSKCKVERELDCFCEDKSKKDGIRPECKPCQKEYRERNKKELSLKQKEYREAKRDLLSLKQRGYYKNNKDLANLKSKKYRDSHKEELKIKKKEYVSLNRDKINKWRRDRLRTNPNFKLSTALRNRINIAFNKGLKKSSTVSLLGTSIENVKKHLESQFAEGMSWENHSLHGWHIDHIRPCASFDLTDLEQQKLCFHYSNLQPLWASDNLKKNDSYNQHTY